MEKFKAELRAFVDGIYEGEKKVLVFGEGSKDARVALVGEAPGEQETLLGRPFVGKAGKNLDEFLALAGLDRSALSSPTPSSSVPPRSPRRAGSSTVRPRRRKFGCSFRGCKESWTWWPRLASSPSAMCRSRR